MRSVASLALLLLVGTAIAGIVFFGQVGPLHKLMIASIAITAHLTVVLIGLLITLVAPRPTWSGLKIVGLVLIGIIAASVLTVGLAVEWGFITVNLTPISRYTFYGLVVMAIVDIIGLLINIT